MIKSLKTSKMNTINKFRILPLMAILFASITIISCSDDDDVPEEEDELEVITDVALIFTPTGGGTAIRATAQDPDDLGVMPLEVLDDITLSADTEYTLTFEILNGLDPDDVEDIGEEILDEDNEHQFFFSFTEGAFANPTGNGNVDTASDAVNYNDQDENGNNVGLSTNWTTASTATTGTFTVILKHQPDIKTATTGATDGETDFNLEFDLTIE